MARIMFTGTSMRAVKNWHPALLVLQSRGHNISSLLFPYLLDPDSRGLDELGFYVTGSVPITDRIYYAASTTLAHCAVEIVRDQRPDVLMLTTCHAGPETALMELLANDPTRPIIIGCQHGFAQPWDTYCNHPCFDYLFVFGRHFFDHAPVGLQHRLVSAGLPKLDLIQPIPRGDFHSDQRPILFAAQTIYTSRLAETLLQLSTVSQRQIIVRPHPERPQAFRELRTNFEFANPDDPLVQQLNRASMLITTGSTTVLEAIAGQVPVVVLPEQKGQLYEVADIVAGRMDPAEILAIASTQSRPDRREALNFFLEDVSGSRNADRSTKAADCVEHIIGITTSLKPRI